MSYLCRVHFKSHTTNTAALIPPSSLVVADRLKHLRKLGGTVREVQQLSVFFHSDWRGNQGRVQPAIATDERFDERPLSRGVVMHVLSTTRAVADNKVLPPRSRTLKAGSNKPTKFGDR